MQTVVYVKLLFLRSIRYGPLLGLPVAPRLTPGLTGLASEVTRRTWVWFSVCSLDIQLDTEISIRLSYRNNSRFWFFCLYYSFGKSWPGVHICTGFDPNRKRVAYDWQGWTKISKVIWPAKYFARLITFSHAEILTNWFVHVNGGTLQMRIAVSRE
jgi:hypothetical protein